MLFPATPSIPVIPWLFPTSSAVPSINLKVVFPDLDDVEHITSILGSLAEAGPDLRTLTILSDARDLHLVSTCFQFPSPVQTSNPSRLASGGFGKVRFAVPAPESAVSPP